MAGSIRKTKLRCETPEVSKQAVIKRMEKKQIGTDQCRNLKPAPSSRSNDQTLQSDAIIKQYPRKHKVT